MRTAEPSGKRKVSNMVRGSDHSRIADRPQGGLASGQSGRGRVHRAGSLLILSFPLFLLFAAGPAPAAGEDEAAPVSAETTAARGSDPVYVPDVSKWLPQANSRESLSATLQVVVIMTLLTVAPSIVLMMTCFVRMVVVLVLLRQALGTQQLPPSQVLVGLALFMTFLVMAPTWEKIRSEAVDPYLDGQMGQMQALTAASRELRSFMFAQIEAADNEDDVYMMYEYATNRTVAATEPIKRGDVPMTALIPAFILSELKTSFILGFRIFLPFLVIDMVISTVLVSMGMMMLPPVLISLPFKLLLFVMADGWHLVANALMTSVH
jgi:flagellar biosynthesis protein FliP